MATQQILDYIKQQQQKGIPPETIKNSLISAGWKISDIEEAFGSLESPKGVEPPISRGSVGVGFQAFLQTVFNQRLILLVYLIGFLLVATWVSGYFLRGKPTQSQPSQTASPTAIPPTATQPTSTPDPTSSWRTHTDETFKFSFRYPADRFPNFFTDVMSANLLILSIASDSGKPDLSSPEKIKQAMNPDEPKIDVFVFKLDLNTKEIALEEFIASKSGTHDATEKESIMIGGERGYTLSKLTFPTDTPPNLQYLQSYRYEGWVKRDKYVYWFSLVSGNKEILLKNKYLFGLLLSTVKFIE